MVFACPYLDAEVDLTDERLAHIQVRHPEFGSMCQELIAATLANPDLVRRSARIPDARLFSRWHEEVKGGKHVVVVVISEPAPSTRHWVVTSYVTGKLVEEVIEWKRD